MATIPSSLSFFTSPDPKGEAPKPKRIPAELLGTNRSSLAAFMKDPPAPKVTEVETAPVFDDRAIREQEGKKKKRRGKKKGSGQEELEMVGTTPDPDPPLE